MPRFYKEGLDYFPLNVDMDDDDKIALIEAKHGVKGFGVIIKLLMKIYKTGYFYQWTEKEQLLFSRRVNVNINELNEIINDAIKWGIFDEGLFNEYQILTSRGIQRRYIEATKRRQCVKVVQSYLLLDKEFINDYKNVVIVNINPENSHIGTQRKEKKSRVKKSTRVVRSHTPEDPPFKAAVYLRDKILENNPRGRVPKDDDNLMQKWAAEMDRLNRLGPPGAKEGEGKGYSWKEIKRLIDWCQQDSFWISNILSASKFREKITTLEAQSKLKGGNKGEGTGKHSPQPGDPDYQPVGGKRYHYD